MHIERKPRKSEAPAARELRAGRAAMRAQPSATYDRPPPPLGLPLTAGLDFMLLLSELKRPRRLGDADPADLYGDFA